MPGRDGDGDLSVREIERQISDMKREKVRLEDSIRKCEANAKRVMNEERYKSAQAASVDGESRKRSRSRSRSGKKEKKEKKGSESGSDKEDDDKKDKDDKEDKEEKEEKDGKDKKDSDDEKDKKDKKDSDDEKEKEARKRRTEGRGPVPDKRARAMFGGLLGHLNKARSRLAEEKGSKAHELRMKAEEKSDQRLAKDKMNIQEIRKQQIEAQKKEEETKLAALEKQVEEKEVALLQRKLETHYSLMMNFIRTQAEPTIFFLPAKHNKETEAKLEETRGAIKHKIASLKTQLQPLPAHQANARGAAAAAALAAAMGETPAKASLPEDHDGNDSEASIPEEKKDKDDQDDKEDGDDDDKKNGEDKKRKTDKDEGDSKEDSKKRKDGDDDSDSGSND